MIFHFQGISVIVPPQIDRKGEVIAIDQGIPNRNEIYRKEQKGALQATRLIANIVLYEKRMGDQAEEAEPIMSFNPPIEFRVGYNVFDILEAGGKNQEDLKLAFWDGGKWVIISDSDHEYRILPPNTGRIAEVKISDWIGDPPIAWVR